MKFSEAVQYLLSLGHETLAMKLGLDAYGVATDGPAPSSLGYQSVRELGAEVKAFLNLHVMRPNTILGEKLPIK